jgi:hypothetical protein
VLHAALDLRTRHASHAQAERKIAQHRHVGVQRVGLEDHADTTRAGVGKGHVLAADLDAAGGSVQQPGDAVQQRGLAAARGAQQHQELTRLHVQVQPASTS